MIIDKYYKSVKERKWISTEQIELLEKYIKNNDSLEIKYTSHAFLLLTPRM